MPQGEPPKPNKQFAFVAAVGALLSALSILAGWWLDWPEELYPIVTGLVGAGLAVWKTGLSLWGDDEKGYARIEAIGVLLGFGLLGAFGVALWVLV